MGLHLWKTGGFITIGSKLKNVSYGQRNKRQGIFSVLLIKTNILMIAGKTNDVLYQNANSNN